MNKPTSVVIIAIVTGLVTALVFERQARTSLNQELRSLGLQVQELAGQVTALQQERERALPPPGLAAVNADEMAELARLRAEVRQLRESLAQLELANAGLSNQVAIARGTDVPFVYPDATKRKDYALAGYSTPQSALQSVLWAITQMDGKAFQGSLTGTMAEGFAPQFQELPEGVMPGGFRNGAMFKASGFRVLEEKPLSDAELVLKVFLEGSRVVIKPVFRKDNGEWKWARNEN